jgi:hypothetical protein
LPSRSENGGHFDFRILLFKPFENAIVFIAAAIQGQLAFRFGTAQRFFPVLFPTGLRPNAISKCHDANRKRADEGDCVNGKAIEIHEAKLLIQRIDVKQDFSIFFAVFSLTLGE